MQPKISSTFAISVIVVLAVLFGWLIWLTGSVEELGRKTVDTNANQSGSNGGNTGIACTQEAKLCPDGKTSVGRTGPNCEFTACPDERTVVYQNEDFNVRLVSKKKESFVTTVCRDGYASNLRHEEQFYNTANLILLSDEEIVCMNPKETNDTYGYYASQGTKLIVSPHSLKSCRIIKPDEEQYAVVKGMCDQYESIAVGKSGFVDNKTGVGIGQDNPDVGYWMKTSKDMVVFVQMYGDETPYYPGKDSRDAYYMEMIDSSAVTE